METEFESRARAGDAVGVLQQAVLNGALWAVGTAWANAFRETTRALLPEDTFDIVLAELMAAAITTALAVGIGICATHSWKQWNPFIRKESAVQTQHVPGTQYPHLYS